jgi:DNA-binding LacI/PurR family transcriptional regulator
MADSKESAHSAVTLLDVSRAAGVSPSTVSRIVNGSPGHVAISARTRERVMAAVERLSYQPHPLARGLRGAATGLIGLIIRDAADPFFGMAIESAAVEARVHGYNVVLGHAGSRSAQALALTKVLETRHCDGLVLLGDLHDEPAFLQQVRTVEMPVVAICQGRRSVGIPTLNGDNRLGTRLALSHLWELGHRRIAYVGPTWIGDAEERREAYADFLVEQGVPGSTSLQWLGDNSPTTGGDGLRSFWTASERPTAILAATDFIALGVLSAALTAGIRIPEQISVVGYDDIPLAAFAAPPLTTVSQPLEEMVRSAIRLLLQLVQRGTEGVHQPPPTVPRLVIRASTAIAADTAFSTKRGAAATRTGSERTLAKRRDATSFGEGSSRAGSPSVDV